METLNNTNKARPPELSTYDLGNSLAFFLVPQDDGNLNAIATIDALRRMCIVASPRHEGAAIAGIIQTREQLDTLLLLRESTKSKLSIGIPTEKQSTNLVVDEKGDHINFGGSAILAAARGTHEQGEIVVHRVNFNGGFRGDKGTMLESVALADLYFDSSITLPKLPPQVFKPISENAKLVIFKGTLVKVDTNGSSALMSQPDMEWQPDKLALSQFFLELCTRVLEECPTVYFGESTAESIMLYLSNPRDLRKVSQHLKELFGDPRYSFFSVKSVGTRVDTILLADGRSALASFAPIPEDTWREVENKHKEQELPPYRFVFSRRNRN